MTKRVKVVEELPLEEGGGQRERFIDKLPDEVVKVKIDSLAHGSGKDVSESGIPNLGEPEPRPLPVPKNVVAMPKVGAPSTLSDEDAAARNKAVQDKIIIVTGGAGFIGTHLIKALNNQGKENILLVDDLTDPRKIHNIKDLKFQDYTDKSKFMELFAFMAKNEMVESLYHLGAESSTACTDGKYLMENNYQYTANLMDLCHMHKVSMVYASSAAVYGEQTKEWGTFDDTSDDYTPQSYYALSKLQADKYSRKFQAVAEDKIVGLRYFNVVSKGEHEQHKDGQKSPLCWMNEQYLRSGCINLFKGSIDFHRDFVGVEDAVWMTMNAMKQARSGVYNIGKGEVKSFYEMALEIVDDVREIKFIEMPVEIASSYQTYTCANMDNAGFSITSRP
jgi:ADP-L-glycero-D-manno-heptose 6-epimerase